MILSLAILLLAGQVESDCVRVPRAGGCVRANGRSGAGFAFFEAFPASGAGTAGVCSTTAPTGARGEVLTFTRGSNGTCTKTATGGLATTGIANGDLVVLSSNVARVEYDSQGVLGLLVEESRQNTTVRSEALDNAAWFQQNNVSAPTLTADYAAAPDGAATAERIQFPATSAAQYSFVYQSGACTASALASGTFYVRGTSGSGTLDIVVYTGAGYTTASCAYVNTSWSRCEKLNVTTVAGTTQFGIGNASSLNGGTARSANDVLVWGAQCENAAYATSYIPTVAAAATRSAETATFPGAAFPANPYSLAVSIYPPTGTTQGDLFYGNAGSTSGVGFFFVASLLRAQNCSSGCATFSPAFTPTALTTTRVATSSTGGQQQTFVNGSSIAGPTATAAAATPWATATGIGPGIGQPDAIISRICVDSDPSRCR